MVVGFSVDCFWHHVGRADALYSLFSTICLRLEDGKRGSKYPYIMNDLYNGKLENKFVDVAMNEVKEIKEGLKKLSFEDVVWDIEDLSMEAKFVYDVSDKSSLLNFYINADRDNFIELLQKALETAKELDLDLTLAVLGFPEKNWLEEFKNNRDIFD